MAHMKPGTWYLKSINKTKIWLSERGKAYLWEAYISGVIDLPTALESALDRRPLGIRLAAWDAARVSVPKQKETP